MLRRLFLYNSLTVAQLRVIRFVSLVYRNLRFILRYVFDRIFLIGWSGHLENLGVLVVGRHHWLHWGLVRVVVCSQNRLNWGLVRGHHNHSAVRKRGVVVSWRRRKYLSSALWHAHCWDCVPHRVLSVVINLVILRIVILVELRRIMGVV